jgi:hypothetical protein
MSLPNSLGAYRDCQDLFERAFADPKGVRAGFATYDAAFAKRQRMHYYRNLDRNANAKMYPSGHPMHGASATDDYMLRIIKDDDTPPKWWLYVEARSAQILHIESLSEVGDLIDVEGGEVHLIEDNSNGI